MLPPIFILDPLCLGVNPILIHYDILLGDKSVKPVQERTLIDTKWLK